MIQLALATGHWQGVSGESRALVPVIGYSRTQTWLSMAGLPRPGGKTPHDRPAGALVGRPGVLPRRDKALFGSSHDVRRLCMESRGVGLTRNRFSRAASMKLGSAGALNTTWTKRTPLARVCETIRPSTSSSRLRTKFQSRVSLRS